MVKRFRLFRKKAPRTGYGPDVVRRGPSFTHWIFIGLLGGIALGLFLGDYTERLKFVGDIYIGLMQMTVLPYIVFSLIGNIGSLSLRELGVLTRAGLLTFLGLWALAALTVMALGQALPDLPVGHFFSASMIDPPPPIDFMKIFIPSNPFQSLADNAVPAVVLFCIFFGVALIGFEERESLLEHIGLIAKTLHRVNGLVVKLTPLGVFGIAAHAAGTLSIEEFGRLQAYYLTFAAGVLILTLGSLPLLMSSLTTFTYRQIFHASKDALVTAFVTGSILPVIPLLIDSVKELFEPYLGQDREHEGFPDFILPLAYPFPNSGNVIDLVFVSFAAWFLGHPLDFGDQLFMLSSSLFLLFGKVFLTIPFLLNSFHIPQDMFQLFLAAGVLAARVGDVLSSMHFMAFTTLTTAYMMGLLTVNWKRLLLSLGAVALVTLAMILAIRYTLLQVESPEYGKESVLSRLTLMENLARAEIEPTSTPNPTPLRAGETLLERIRRRGLIRVGFRPDYIPYSYCNTHGDLVGHDVDMINKLALDLKVGVEYVPYTIETLDSAMRNDHFDVAVSGLTVSLSRTEAMLFSDPYLVVSMGLVVEDHRIQDFSSEQRIRRQGGIRLGVSRGSVFEERARQYFPEADIVPLDSIRDFFDKPSLHLQALVTHAESGAGWTLVYPDYSVVNPLGHRDSAPVSIAIGDHDESLNGIVNTWINLNKMNGTLDSLFQHWMLGKTRGVDSRRWSIIRDVLHWVS